MKRYTNAPESYDGFGTRTVGRFEARRHGRTVQFREVEIDHEFDDWQRERYLSGLYEALDDRDLAMLYER